MAPVMDSRRDRGRRAARQRARIAGSIARAAGSDRRTLLRKGRRGRRASARPAVWATAAVLLVLAGGSAGYLVLDRSDLPDWLQAEPPRGDDLLPASVLLTEEDWADYVMLERGRRVHAELEKSLEGNRRESERIQTRLRLLSALLDRTAREAEEERVRFTEAAWADVLTEERARRRTAGLEKSLDGSRQESRRLDTRFRVLRALHDRTAREAEEERARFAEAAWADVLTEERARRRTAGLEKSLDGSRQESRRLDTRFHVLRALHDRNMREAEEERARFAEAAWAGHLTRERARRQTAELEGSLSDRTAAVGRARLETRILLALANRMAYELRADIERIRTLLGSTGVGLEQLVKGNSVRVLAQGGPFEGVEDAFGAAVATLEEELDRRRSLQTALRQIPLASPLDYYYLSSRYGMRKDPINGRRAMHHGIDMVPPFLERVLAPAPGVVTFSGRNGGFGRFVEIDHGNGIVTRYGHLRRVYVRRGDEVGFRDRIAQVGRTGRSTGVHLHYEITIDGKSVDPLKFIMAGKNVFED